MNCHQARRHFGAYWDDELTQAEREWLEGHFAACERCRREYDERARVMEGLAALPRLDAPPHFSEQVLARARRAATVPDRVPAAAPAWMPVTAGALALLLVGTLAAPWLGPPDDRGVPSGVALAPPQPVAVTPAAPEASPPSAPAESDAGPGAVSRVASLPDSLFDPAANVEFILDAVPLRRGRAELPSPALPVQAERAVISF